MTHTTDAAPVDLARHRALIASIYASLPFSQQAEALKLIEHWPRMIHTLARAGELSTPELALSAA